jgi:hypothetical protein
MTQLDFDSFIAAELTWLEMVLALTEARDARPHADTRTDAH